MRQTFVRQKLADELPVPSDSKMMRLVIDPPNQYGFPESLRVRSPNGRLTFERSDQRLIGSMAVLI
jgi:hypothetical protein